MISLSQTASVMYSNVAVGSRLAKRLGLKLGDYINFDPNATERPTPFPQYKTGINHPQMKVAGIVSTGSIEDDRIFLTLHDAQLELFGISPESRSSRDDISRVEISARTKPEDAFARVDPDSLPAKQKEIWYCHFMRTRLPTRFVRRFPGLRQEQVRRVEQSEYGAGAHQRVDVAGECGGFAGGGVWFCAGGDCGVGAAGRLLVMRSLGASKGAIAMVVLCRDGSAGSAGRCRGVSAWLGSCGVAGGVVIFTAGDGAASVAVLNPVLLPVAVAAALLSLSQGAHPPFVRRFIRIPRRSCGRMPDASGHQELTFIWGACCAARWRASPCAKPSMPIAMTGLRARATALLTLYADLDAKLHKEFRSFGANIKLLPRLLALSPFCSPMRREGWRRRLVTMRWWRSSGYAVATTDRGTSVVVTGTDFDAVKRLTRGGRWMRGLRLRIRMRSLGQRAADFIANEHDVTLTFAGKATPLHGAGRLRTGGDEDSRIYMPMAASLRGPALRPA